MAAADVPVGGGVILDKEKLVVTQPEAGTFKAFSSTCTHQGCTVTKVADGTIDCPCHGSTFSVEDGSVQGGPAPSPLPETAGQGAGRRGRPCLSAASLRPSSAWAPLATLTPPPTEETPCPSRE